MCVKWSRGILLFILFVSAVKKSFFSEDFWKTRYGRAIMDGWILSLDIHWIDSQMDGQTDGRMDGWTLL